MENEERDDAAELPDLDRRPDPAGLLVAVKKTRLYAGARRLKNYLMRLFHERGGLRDTSVIIEADELAFDNPEHRAYEASRWPILRRALRPYRITKDDVFADFGAGMGRVVWQAAHRYDFGRVIGIEIAESLAQVARENIERSHESLKCPDVEIVTCDALEFEVPDDLTFAYFYNPFVGETFRGVIENVIASLDRNPRRLVLIYAFPTMREMLESTGRFVLTQEVRSRRPDVSRENELRWINVYESRGRSS